MVDGWGGKVSQGFKKHYPGNVLLKLLKTIYGLKQAALTFWRELLKFMQVMKMTRIAVDPWTCFKWAENGLIMICIVD